MGDKCPKGCKHLTFHFCMASGTHCDLHCVCKCRLCTKEKIKKATEANNDGDDGNRAA